MLQIDTTKIKERNDRLDAVCLELRQHFVGIDDIIVELINAMRIWYVMPDVLVRPVIINLWGMTGVGKTDLVRKLVKALNLQDRFAEIELSNIDQTQYYSSVTAMLEQNRLNDTDPKILFFDEMQRFNTTDQEGKQLQSMKFGDFWELLSDGRLAKRTRDSIDDLLFEYQYALHDSQRRKKAGEDVEVDGEIGHWPGRMLKQRLNLTEEVDEIAMMSQSKIIERIRQAKDRKIIYEPVDHSKSLIIISGNLDEAFAMARAASEADVDADIFHAFTRKITIIDIKRALSQRFKPEQVARFGNIHLIYRSLSKEGYEMIITREVERVVAMAHDRFGISLKVDHSLNELIYRNGVFPVQGVRPVFSSVIDILETNLSKLLFEALIGSHNRVKMSYDKVSRQLLATVGDTTTLLPFVGRLDNVRERNVLDLTTNIAVHEAGHAVAYILLFGLSPLQLTSKATSTYAASFMFPHEIIHTRWSMIAKAKVYLAGGLAEELVFGANNATIGRSDDREQVTQLILDYLRRYGFDERFQATYALDGAHYMDRSSTDLDGEKMIGRLVSETTQLLLGHKPFLIELARRLRAAGEMTAADVAACAQDFNLAVQVAPEGHQHMPTYTSLMAPADAAVAAPAIAPTVNGSKPVARPRATSRTRA
jgi:hypothetical protein